ncbi:VanZ family protein [Frigoribacterium sp. 2-23]|uniref:VanZ family protein n=1 Tax=Frigoribacterium sp. 2-23 TaxID=3415006 RepID=UPI003C6F3ED6
MTTRHAPSVAARVLALYVVAVAAVAFGLALSAGFRALGHTVGAAVLTAARAVGLLTFSDGAVQAALVALLIVPLVPLADRATHTRRLAPLVAGAALVVLVPVLVLPLSTSGGAGTTVDRLLSLTTAAIAGLLLSTLVALALRSLRGRLEPTRRVRRLAMRAAVVYGVVVAAVAFTARPVDSGVAPLLDRVLTNLHRVGMPAWIDYGVVEFGANIGFFVPVGLVVVLLVGHARWWWGVASGFVLSSLIEMGQLLFLPQRFASLDDVLANTTGATLGALLGALALARLLRDGSSRSHDAGDEEARVRESLPRSAAAWSPHRSPWRRW